MVRIILKVSKIRYLENRMRICRRCGKHFETPCRKGRVCTECMNPRGRPVIKTENINKIYKDETVNHIE